MEQVIYLPVRDQAALDSGHLFELNKKLGATVADNLICQSMEDLAVRLATAERQCRAGNVTELRKLVRQIDALGDQLGLTSLCRVARDVMGCLRGHDPVALAATVARMIRTGEASMSAVWDHQEPFI